MTVPSSGLGSTELGFLVWELGYLGLGTSLEPWHTSSWPFAGKTCLSSHRHSQEEGRGMSDLKEGDHPGKWPEDACRRVVDHRSCWSSVPHTFIRVGFRI